MQSGALIDRSRISSGLRPDAISHRSPLAGDMASERIASKLAPTQTGFLMDRYCVFGNPIGHSKSPLIHRLFAEQTGQALTYDARLAPLDDFAGDARSFFHDGLGANVTVPFKEEAFRLADQLSERARRRSEERRVGKECRHRWSHEH